MQRELWPILAGHLTELSRTTSTQRFLHPTPRILRVYLWAVMHDRPVSWACNKRNWAGAKPPARLPDQSTMSRRFQRDDTQAMLNDLLDRLESAHSQQLIWRLDGKALPIAKHSRDRQARIERGTGGFQNGYRFHAIYASNNRPLAYDVYPMNVDERVVARQMIAQLPASEGYLLADSNYEINPLYDQAAAAGRILVTPRRFRHAKGLGQSRKHSTHRIAMIARMQSPSDFTRKLLATRKQIETRFANLCSFGGGLTHLPPWVRGNRVKMFVTAKILIRLARDQYLKQTKRA